MENLEAYKYKRAKAKVACLRAFHIHLIVYLMVIALLVFINYMITSYPWAIFPAFGWGVGLLAHWLHAYGAAYILGSGWEQRKIQQLMEEDEF